MKSFFIILLCILGPAAGFGQVVYPQTPVAYEAAMGKFMKFYNHNEPDSIIELFSTDWGEERKKLWSAEVNNAMVAGYGKIKSYKYLGQGIDEMGDGLAFFEVVCEKSTHIAGFSMDKQDKLETFHFKTSAPHIDSLPGTN